MNPIGEILVRHMVRRFVIALLIAAAIGGLVMIGAIEYVKRNML